MRYLIRLKFKKSGLIGEVFAMVIERLTNLANTIFTLIKPIVERFGYRLLKVNFYKSGEYYYLDIVVEKIKSPQIIALIIEILEAITPILSRLGLIFLGYSLYEYAKAQEKQAEVKEIEAKTAQEVIETAKKTNPRSVDKIARIIYETKTTEEEKKETASPISQIIQVLNLIMIIILFINVIIPVFKVIWNVVSRRLA